MTILTLAECGLSWESGSPEETERLGAALGRCLRPGDVVALLGDLGSGKTVLVRGMAAGLGCRPEDVHSPSFTLVNEYAYPRPQDGGFLRKSSCLAHVDLYRIQSAADVPGIGWDEYMGSRYVVAVEWAERAAGFLPRDHLRVHLAVQAADRRRVCVEATGPRSVVLLREWAGTLGPIAGAG
jgi:tRNA threonylcarbamoyladenosine biosynthesis protein TsaE